MGSNDFDVSEYLGSSQLGTRLFAQQVVLSSSACDAQYRLSETKNSCIPRENGHGSTVALIRYSFSSATASYVAAVIANA